MEQNESNPTEGIRVISAQAKMKAEEHPNCRAKRRGAGNLVDCLIESPYYCSYALSFGLGHFCMHPKALEIVERTKAADTPTLGMPPLESNVSKRQHAA